MRNQNHRWLLLSGLVMLCVSSAQADPLKSLAKKLAKGAQTLDHKRVAVLVFPYENGNLSSGSSLVSEQLTTQLAGRRGVRVIERSLLSHVLGELRLEESGVTDSSGSAKAGGISGVDAVVTGTLEDLENGRTVVNARLIQLPTGEILTAATAEIKRNWQDAPHPPPTLVEVTEKQEEPEPYVLHASKLIYTPTMRRGVPVRMEPEGSSLGLAGPPVSAPPPERGETGSPPSVSGPGASVTIVNLPPAPRYEQRNYRARERSQFLYAMGVTLDLQGHPRQASRYYQHLLRESPSRSPLRAQVRRRLATESVDRVKGR